MQFRELEEDERSRVLRDGRLGRLACSHNGQPFIVPLNFVFDGGEYLYAFSTVVQEIRWMRKNPRVCVEIDKVEDQNDRVSIFIFGKYEELPNTPEFQEDRAQAHELLSKYPMWWQPAYGVEKYRETSEEQPVYFRIHIEKITGHRTCLEKTESYIDAGKLAVPRREGLWGLW